MLRSHVFGFVAAICLSIGCGKQAEGERCDLANASLDCEPGLVCRDASDLGLGAEGDLQRSALCCPPADGTTPTVDVCRGEATLPQEESPPQTEEPPPETVLDAGVTPDATPAP